MIDYFKEEFLIQSKKQRAKTLNIYLIVLLLYISLSAVVLIRYMQLPYQAPQIGVIKTVEFIMTFIFLVFSFVYLGIKYKRVNKFYEMCKNISIGIKEEFTANFFEYDENLSVKDGVDVKSLVFLQWNKFKNDYFERKVFVFYEKPFPEFKPNDEVRFITQGNVLVSYEIIEEEN